MEIDTISTVESDKPTALAQTFLADSQKREPIAINTTPADDAAVEIHHRDTHYDGDDEAEAEPSGRPESSSWPHNKPTKITTLSRGIQKPSQKHGQNNSKDKKQQGLLLRQGQARRNTQSWRGRYIAVQARVRETARRAFLSTFLGEGEGGKVEDKEYLTPRAVKGREDGSDDSTSAQKGNSDDDGSGGLLAR